MDHRIISQSQNLPVTSGTLQHRAYEAGSENPPNKWTERTATILKNVKTGHNECTGMIAWRCRVLTALSESRSSDPGTTNTRQHKCPWLQFQGIQHSFLESMSICVRAHPGTHAHNKLWSHRETSDIQNYTWRFQKCLIISKILEKKWEIRVHSRGAQSFQGRMFQVSGGLHHSARQRLPISFTIDTTLLKNYF